nr:response regulator [uncultured Eisenbergiella sp.]
MYRVFLADDEPWIVISLKNLIDWGEYGFLICGEATDGIKAWERIQRTKPDLILSDIKMPGMDGIELIQKVREERIPAEVAIISGYSDFEYARAGLKYGCTDYLIKPVDEEELISCLEKVKEKLDGIHGEAPKEEAEEDGYRSEGRLLKEILKYIRDNYRTVTQQQLAEEFGLGISSVSQMIKRRTGKSYSDHLLEIRICKAQELLRLTNDSIEDISEKVGYSDYFYFLKVFKKATGISPSAFRRNLS